MPLATAATTQSDNIRLRQQADQLARLQGISKQQHDELQQYKSKITNMERENAKKQEELDAMIRRKRTKEIEEAAKLEVRKQCEQERRQQQQQQAAKEKRKS